MTTCQKKKQWVCEHPEYFIRIELISKIEALLTKLKGVEASR